MGCLADGSCPTSFPAPCALSASFNMSLVADMGNVIGRELRAYVNAKVGTRYRKQGNREQESGTGIGNRVIRRMFMLLG